MFCVSIFEVVSPRRSPTRTCCSDTAAPPRASATGRRRRTSAAEEAHEPLLRHHVIGHRPGRIRQQMRLEQVVTSPIGCRLLPASRGGPSSSSRKFSNSSTPLRGLRQRRHRQRLLRRAFLGVRPPAIARTARRCVDGGDRFDFGREDLRGSLRLLVAADDRQIDM